MSLNTFVRKSLLDDGILSQLLAALDRVILGKSTQTRHALACCLARGHLLIDDLPGLGKTTLAHALARLLGLQFSRIQFTSDMLPADIIGLSLFDRENQSFRFVAGPIFAQCLLADEINRATPKTQSALLEAMAEGQVTSEGETRPLPKPFFVIATQNPYQQIGTFPLPESQLDRFMARIEMGYPDYDAEMALLSAHESRPAIEAIANHEMLADLATKADAVFASPALIAYVRALLDETRRDSAFRHGLSPRAGIALLAMARAVALIAGRDMVLPDDIQDVFPVIARHRLASAQQGSMVRAHDLTALLERVPY